MKPLVRIVVLLVVVLALWRLVHTAPAAAPEPAEEKKPRAADGGRKGSPLDSIRLPPGFSISVFARGVEGARSMVYGEKGTLFVGTRDIGNVYALRDPDGDGVADEGLVILEDLPGSNGLAVHDGDLYVGGANLILRIDDVEKNLESPPKPVVVYDRFPKARHHGWRYMGFGPDGWLYVAIGAPCNVCDEKEPFSTIMRMRPDGSGLEAYAKGVRNSVGFDWHPETKELWFTDNGRDNMGDDVPGDELNRAPKGGMHFGFPYCHQGDVADPEFGAERPCGELTAPEQVLGPHVAAIGMRFYTGTAFPEEYRGKIFIAEHGSWNRSKPIGYRVMVVDPEAEGEGRYKPFAEGWLRPDDRVWGRPADVIVAPDGALLVSDDANGAIYRIIYSGDKAA